MRCNVRNHDPILVVMDPENEEGGESETAVLWALSYCRDFERPLRIVIAHRPPQISSDAAGSYLRLYSKASRQAVRQAEATLARARHKYPQANAVRCEIDAFPGPARRALRRASRTAFMAVEPTQDQRNPIRAALRRRAVQCPVVRVSPVKRQVLSETHNSASAELTTDLPESLSSLPLG